MHQSHRRPSTGTADSSVEGEVHVPTTISTDQVVDHDNTSQLEHDVTDPLFRTEIPAVRSDPIAESVDHTPQFENRGQD
jgi:hypothetical protein